MTGIAIIAEERLRHTNAEGFDAAHDDKHANGEILSGAIAYALVALYQTAKSMRLSAFSIQELYWPWNIASWKPNKTDRIRNLAKAGAMIAAEIDRIQREEAK